MLDPLIENRKLRVAVSELEAEVFKLKKYLSKACNAMLEAEQNADDFKSIRLKFKETRLKCEEVVLEATPFKRGTK